MNNNHVFVTNLYTSGMHFSIFDPLSLLHPIYRFKNLNYYDYGSDSSAFEKCLLVGMEYMTGFTLRMCNINSTHVRGFVGIDI